MCLPSPPPLFLFPGQNPYFIVREGSFMSGREATQQIYRASTLWIQLTVLVRAWNSWAVRENRKIGNEIGVWLWVAMGKRIFAVFIRQVHDLIRELFLEDWSERDWSMNPRCIWILGHSSSIAFQYSNPCITPFVECGLNIVTKFQPTESGVSTRLPLYN